MNQVSIVCSLPFCQNTQGKQTNISVGARITALVVGIIAAIIGILIVLNVPGLGHFGAIAGWAIFSIGALIAVVGATLKCIKKPEGDSTSTPPLETPADKQQAVSSSIHPLSQAVEESKNPEFKPIISTVNWCEANSEIRTQVKEMWPKRIERFERGVPEGDRIICITEESKLIGCVALEQTVLSDPPNLVDEVSAQKVYKLDIQIDNPYQGKGYGRIVFNTACATVIEEGAAVYLIDQAAPGIGVRLYGGEKTCEAFDVFHLFNGERGEYLLKKKTQVNGKLNYLKIIPENIFVFWIAVESIDGFNHLINYLNAYPEDASLIDVKILTSCQSTIDRYRNVWPMDKLKNYEENFNKLKIFLKQKF